MATTDTGGHTPPVEPHVEESLLKSPTAVAALEQSNVGLVASAQLAGGGRPVRRIRGWFELILAVVGYCIYAEARTLNGHDPNAHKAIAARHGRALFDFEKNIGIDWEKGLQHNLLPYKGFLQVLGGFYGGAHFVITIGVLVWMLFRRPQFYRFWRTVLFTLTMVAVGIFALFPAEPPRTLTDASGHTITVDTLSRIGGLWSYNHGVIERISDPFAPMPSLHLGWATWVALALWFTLPARSWWRRGLVILYPFFVYFVVIATGTHFVIDGIAGMALTVTVVFVSARIVIAYRRGRPGAAHPGSTNKTVSQPIDLSARATNNLA